MKLYFKVSAILFYSFLAASCDGNKTGAKQSSQVQKFVQPEILIRNSAFDIAQLNFKENVLQLVSKSLDTADTGFKGKGYDVFKSKPQLNRSEITDGYFALGEERYFFKTRELDSIARFDSLYFYRVGIETDKDKNLLAITANTKFEHKKDLDKFLGVLFKKLGKTIEEVAIQADHQKNIDEAKARGLSDKDINFLGYNEQPKYDLYDYGDKGYFEWKLKDRYVQVSLSKDREIHMSTNPQENSNIEYLYVEFLVIKKEEYEKIQKLQYDRAVKFKRESYILKPYELRGLKLEYNQRYLQKLTKAWEGK